MTPSRAAVSILLGAHCGYACLAPHYGIDPGLDEQAALGGDAGAPPTAGALLGAAGVEASAGDGSGGADTSSGGSPPMVVEPGVACDPDGTYACNDADTAQFCDSMGVMQSIDCTKEFASDGLISNGCMSDVTGNRCTIDDFIDMACADGVGPFALCTETTESELIELYVSCFHDTNGSHTVISCYADFVIEPEQTIDCTAANAACLP